LPKISISFMFKSTPIARAVIITLQQGGDTCNSNVNLKWWKLNTFMNLPDGNRNPSSHTVYTQMNNEKITAVLLSILKLILWGFCLCTWVGLLRPNLK
jgi:hypothetical protein